ncbi:MAG: hypothetical protein Pg6C_18530 [Treponemataceae bacterium]|nr:MAG: hypothetical protein Pg6C_18530 [Treponemataceae bacterium]
MNKKWKAVVITAALLLIAGTLVFAQFPGSSRQGGEQKAPFSLGGQVNCGPGGNYGGCGGYDDGNDNGGNYGNGGGYGCH